jgi:hypothetical protein
MSIEAWYDPTNQVVSTDKNDPRFTPLGQLWRLVPEREGVGLTDEEIYDIREDFTFSDEDFNEFGFAKAIEAKLKEKNRG